MSLQKVNSMIIITENEKSIYNIICEIRMKCDMIDESFI